MIKLNIESIDLRFKEVLRNYSCLALASRASERILSLFMGPRKKTKYFRLLQNDSKFNVLQNNFKSGVRVLKDCLTRQSILGS